MQNKYPASLKASLFCKIDRKDAFFLLIKYFPIDELKNIPAFNELKTHILQTNIAPQEIFDRAAMQVVRKNMLPTIRFLIDECGFRLANLHSKNQITLLHEACLFGDRRLIEYLLAKGFSAKACDYVGETPLHRLMKRKDGADVIKLLTSHNADLNAQTNTKVTPLHMAVVEKNPEAISVLLKLGANKALTYNGLTYLQLQQFIHQGKFQVQRSIGVPPKKDFIETANANYCKGCLSPGIDTVAFQAVITNLLEQPEKLIFSQLKILLQAWVLIRLPNEFKPEVLRKKILQLARENKIVVGDAINCLLNIADFFAHEKQVEMVKQLNQLVLELMNNAKNSTENKCLFYALIGISYKEIRLLEKSERYFQLAFNHSDGSSDQFKLEICFNLATVQAFLMKSEAALENFRLAFNFDKKDTVSFQRYVGLLLQKDNYEEALTVCREVNFGKLSQVFACFTHVLRGDLTWSDLLAEVSEDSADERTQILLLDLRSECYLRHGRYDEAIAVAEKAFTLAEKNLMREGNFDSHIENSVVKLLQKMIHVGQYQRGLAWLELFEKKYSIDLSSCALYHSAAAALYAANQKFEQANSAIETIKKLHFDTNILVQIYCSLGVEAFSMNSAANGDIALYYINLALELNPDYLKGQFYKLLLQILIKDKKVAEETLQTIDPEALLDISLAKNVVKEDFLLSEDATNSVLAIDTTGVVDKESQNEENLVSEPLQEKLEIEIYDQVKIHQFFQAEKQRLLKESAITLLQTLQPKVKWKIGPVSFEEGKDGLVEIKHHTYSPCYAVIHPQLVLPPELREMFQAALNKGVATRKDTDGAQTLSNAVMQLAIRAENRLFTTQVYRNPQGQYLFVFDKHKNHPAVKKIARKTRPLAVVQCEQFGQPLEAIIRSDSIFTSPSPNFPANTQISGTISLLNM